MAAPTGNEKLEAGENDEGGGDIVAEAVFASEKVEDFLLEEVRRGFTLPSTPVARFAKHFSGDGPTDRRDRNAENEKGEQLLQRGVQKYAHGMRYRGYGSYMNIAPATTTSSRRSSIGENVSGSVT